MIISINELRNIIKTEIKKKLQETFVPKIKRLPENPDDYDISLEEKIMMKYQSLVDSLNEKEFGDLVLYIFDTKSEVIFIAIDPEIAKIKLIDHFKEIISNQDMPFKYDSNIFYEPQNNEENILDLFIGYIKISRSISPSCYRSWTTDEVAADRSIGPLMYSLAASYVKDNGGQYTKITSDRRKVKSAARNIWKNNYFKRVYHFDAYELDNYNLPKKQRKTPDEIDDCYLYDTNDPTDKYVNHTYEIRGSGKLNYKIFEKSFEKFIDVIADGLSNLFMNVSKIKIKNDLKQYLLRLVTFYFQEKFESS